MGALKQQLKNLIKTIAIIVRNRQFRLLFYLSSIDQDFLCRAQIPDKASWENFVHPLFDPVFYCSRYLGAHHTGSPFLHFLSEGYVSGNRPGPFFDYDIYQLSTDWRPGRGNPLKHYLSSGFRQGRPGIFFDAEWYRDRTPALHERALDPVKHYKRHGSKEGKSPIPLFDPQWNRQTVRPSNDFTDALSHYLLHGMEAGSAPCRFFEPHYYQQRYSAELGEFSPFEHYLREGVYTGNYIAGKVEKLEQKPLISIIVPVYNTEPCFLNNCIRSVLYQQYPHWQLCLADDGSTREGIREQLELWSGRDKRIKIIFREHNGGISAASNSAASLASGDYLAFLDNDDELTPDCLYRIAEKISNSSPDIVYTDEALVGDDGRKFSTFRKPGFNRVLLASHNYITHFVAVSKQIFTDCRGFRPRYDGAQDLDFMLRATGKAEKIAHIPRVLYLWRATKTSTSINHSQKSYAHEAGKKALQDRFEQTEDDVSVKDGDITYSYRIQKRLGEEGSVSVLSWGGAAGEVIAQFTPLRARTSYKDCKFIFFTSGQASSPDSTFDMESTGADGCQFVRKKAGATKAQVFDEYISSCSSDYIIIVESSVVDVEPDWIQELVSQMSYTDAVSVCGRFSFLQGDGPSYTLPDIGRSAPHYFHQFLTSCSRHANGIHYQQFIQYAPWDICIFRRSDYLRLGGFDHEKFPNLFAMTDLCLRAARQGGGNLYTPYARVYKKGSKGAIAAAMRQSGVEEMARFKKTWHTVLSQKDPYYNLGILDENNIDRDEFMNWLTGGA